jgi:hypothetical protein
MEPSMSSTKKPRATKLLRPAADASCTLARTVDRSGLSLGVWSCSSPSPGEPLDTSPQLRLAPTFEKVGRLLHRFFYVTRADTAGDNAAYREPGWYFEPVNPKYRWGTGENGWYRTLDAAIADARWGASEGLKPDRAVSPAEVDATSSHGGTGAESCWACAPPSQGPFGCAPAPDL